MLDGCWADAGRMPDGRGIKLLLARMPRAEGFWEKGPLWLQDCFRFDINVAVRRASASQPCVGRTMSTLVRAPSEVKVGKTIEIAADWARQC